MRLLAPLVENPWCLALLMALALLLVISAALVAWAERARATTVGYPPANYPARHVAGSAPLEALAALHSRLLELQRHLPPARRTRIGYMGSRAACGAPWTRPTRGWRRPRPPSNLECLIASPLK